MGKILAVCISGKKGTTKKNVGKCKVIEDFGLEGDAHAGRWHRQISLLGIESVEKMRLEGIDINCGGFGENLTTEGIVLHELGIGTKLKIGEVILEVSQIGKICHRPCEIFKRTGKCVMSEEGIFAKVIRGGEIKVGNEIEALTQT